MILKLEADHKDNFKKLSLSYKKPEEKEMLTWHLKDGKVSAS